MRYPIYNLSINRRYMPNTKASRGGEKITVKFTIVDNSNYRNRIDTRIVFHHDRVSIVRIRYHERFVEDGRFSGHMEKSDYSKVFKRNHDFNMFYYGFTYKGEELDELAMVDLALKMYLHKCLELDGIDLYIADC